MHEEREERRFRESEAARICMRKMIRETTAYGRILAGSALPPADRYIFQFDRHVFPMSDRKMAGSIGSQSWITCSWDHDERGCG